MDLWTIVLALIIGGVCIYLFSNSKYSYFKKRGIPYVKPYPIFGNMNGMILRTKPMAEIIDETYKCHPDAKYVGFFDCYTPAIILKDPELVKSIGIKNFDSFPNHKMFFDTSTEPLFQKNLFALENDAWRDMRTLLSPAFTSSKMKLMFKILSDCAINFTDYLTKQNPQPEQMDMKDTFGRYTLDVIASAAFGLSVNSMKDRNNEFYLLGKSVTNFSGSMLLKFMILRLFPWFAKFFNIRLIGEKTARFFSHVIKTTIETRDEQGIVRPDMIQLMMQARDKKDLSPEDITAQAFIFLLGGFESPATTMSFTAYLLALNPHVQTKLQQEIDQVLEKSSGEVSYEDLQSMKYLDGVINETLRLFPPTTVLDRVATQSFTLPPALPGLEPFEIKPGQGITIPSYSIHRDPLYFPNPDKFDPERFSEENKSEISPFTYMPFGLGPRICIANRFALMEVKLVLLYLLSKFNIATTSKTVSPIKLSAKSFMMQPEGGFCLKLESRK